MPDAKPYKVFPGPNMALSQTALEAVSAHLQPSSIFELHIHPSQLVGTRRLLRKLGCDVEENPFAPYVNLVLDKELGMVEWYAVDANGDAVGCEGL